LLNLTELSRRFLTTVGALASDASGEETLAGLTVSESDFFIMYQERRDLNEPLYKTDKFHRLMELHLIARQLKLVLRKSTGISVTATPQAAEASGPAVVALLEDVITMPKSLGDVPV
jgi:hypothetical protein